MARNGSGTYNLLNNTAYPGVNGVTMTAADWNAFALDIANALTGSVAADGQTPLTGNLNANNNKLTGLAAGSATGQSVRWEQLFSQGAEADIASAGTCDIGAQNTNFLRVTGTTTIASLGTNYNGPRFLRFSGALTLTHNATTLILPGGANITTAAGDSCVAMPVGNPGSGWQVLAYQRAATAPEWSVSKATSGYQKLPSGLTMQWGVVATNGSGVGAITFPTAFATACVNVQGIASSTGPANNLIVGVNPSTFTTTGATVYAATTAGAAASQNVYWSAIGY